MIGKTAMRMSDGQIGRILDVKNGVALFLPFNSGKEELQYLKDLEIVSLIG